MKVTHTATELRQQLNPLRSGKAVAFVPTMGCLHQGHLSLIQQAKEIADIVVVSTYVNPLQFGPNEDLAAYPRTFDDDATLCREAGVDIIFQPHNLYPDDGPKITLKATGLCDCLCGSARPGHFDGVITVVNILFNIVQPDIALFGEKDWQQLTIIRRMVSDLQMPVQIATGATFREMDGLALSSRNRYLTASDRKQALSLSQALKAVQQQSKDGEKNCHRLIDHARQLLAGAGITPQYLEIRDAATLQRIPKLGNQPARIFIAASIGNARLIDNMSIPQTTTSTSETEHRSC